MQSPHQLCRNIRARCDACSELREAFVLNGAVGKEFELGEEHCRYAVQRCAFLFLHCSQCGFGIERLGREDDAGAVGCGRRVAEDGAETVEEGGRTADYVGRGEEHALADGEAVVEDRAVG